MDLKFRFTRFFSLLALALLGGFSVFVYFQIKAQLMLGAERELVSHLEHDSQHLQHEHGKIHSEKEGRHYLIQLRVWKNGKMVEDSFAGRPFTLEDSTDVVRDDKLFKQITTKRGDDVYNLVGSYDLQPTVEYLSTLKRVLFLGCMLAFLLVIPLSLLSTKRLLNPFATLSHAAGQLDAERLSFRFPEPRFNDEYGLLVKSFNSLLRRLERGFGELGRFATNASHELRTPVAVILSQADFALRRSRSEEDYVDALSKIQDKARHLEGIITQLLALSDVSRVDPGRKEKVRIKSAIQELSSIFSSKYPQKVVKRHLPNDLTYVGSREVFYCILSNLLENAVKHCRSVAKVSAQTIDGEIRVVVEDDGPGIPKDEMEAVFEPFVRAKGVSESVKGHGLGLSLVQKCLEVCRGRIELAESPLGGLRAEFFLPIQEAGLAS